MLKNQPNGEPAPAGSPIFLIQAVFPVPYCRFICYNPRMLLGKKIHFFVFLILAACLFFSSCTRRLGWGVLLWSVEDPFIPSGTVLPVYFRSNINRVYGVGVPSEFRTGTDGLSRIEVPISQFELVGSRRNANNRAQVFSRYARTYAENLFNRLPIRALPDNSSTIVYRMRLGEIIKILERAEGVQPIGTTGAPLPGYWYRVLARDGTTGFTFSQNLRFFEHYGGSLEEERFMEEMIDDPYLNMLLANTWSPEIYGQMISSRRIDIAAFERRWGFDPGQYTGIARISLPDTELIFEHRGIRPDGHRAWHFEGTSLNMTLRSNTNLTVQFTENPGGLRTINFIALPMDKSQIIAQENNRRNQLFAAIYNHGPIFTSNGHGTIVFSENGAFEWTGFESLIPDIVPQGATGRGRVGMDLFLTPSFEHLYTGACTFHFLNHLWTEIPVHFMYTLEPHGLRLEVVPGFGVEHITVTRRSPTPMVIFFFRDDVF